MAGISQLWLTEKELGMVADALRELERNVGPFSSEGQRRFQGLVEKVEAARGPVACPVEPGKPVACDEARDPSLTQPERKHPVCLCGPCGQVNPECLMHGEGR